MEPVDINILKPNAKNPRQISKHDYDNLVQSIKRFGDLSGVVFNETTEQLVGGHQRIEAFRQLGGQPQIANRLPEPNSVGTVATGYVLLGDEKYSYRVVRWDKDFETAANIAANRIQGDWNTDMLAELTYELSQLENSADLLALTGQSEDELSRLMDSVGAGDNTEEDEPPEVDEVNPPVSKLGEIYQLGAHRLMCGSATDYGQVTDLLNGNNIKLVLSDPPYGVDIVSGGSSNGTVGGDSETQFGKVGGGQIVEAKTYAKIIGDDTTDTARDSFRLCQELGITDYIIWGGNYFTDFLKPKACWVIWDKQNTGNFADVEMAWTSFDRGAKLYHYMWNGLAREGNRADELESRVHPTQKPVGMQANVLADFSSREDTVLDLFGGSGSCLIACEKMGRKCFMMELSPAYCDVIRKRYAKYVGQEENWQGTTPIVQAAPEAVPDEPPAA